MRSMRDQASATPPNTLTVMLGRRTISIRTPPLTEPTSGPNLGDKALCALPRAARRSTTQVGNLKAISNEAPTPCLLVNVLGVFLLETLKVFDCVAPRARA